MISSRKSVLCAMVAAGLCGCFNQSSYTPILVRATTVGATIFDAQTIPTGTTQIMVYGYYVDSSTVISWKGRRQTSTFTGPGPTDFLSGLSGMKVDLEPGVTDVVGAGVLTARNDADLQSVPFTLPVVDADLTVSSISPATIPFGAPDTVITFTGAGFNPSAKVSWNGTALATTFVSNATLTAVAPAALLAISGDAKVQVAVDSHGCSPQCNTTATGIIAVGSSALVKVNLEAADLAWDAAHSLLFGLVQGNLTTIDPKTGALGSPAGNSVGGANQLAISDDGQFLYQSDPAQRLELPGLTNPVTLPSSGSTVAVAPGAPQTVALAGFGRVTVVDGIAPRPNVGQTVSQDALTWGSDASALYDLSPNSGGVLKFAADQNGLTQTALFSVPQIPSHDNLVFDPVTRRLYLGSGQTMDEQGGDLQTFPLGDLSRAQCLVAVDGALGKAFFACSSSDVSIRSFDLRTRQLISTVFLEPSAQGLLRIVRWGSSGLAVAAAGRFYLYSGTFVQ